MRDRLLHHARAFHDLRQEHLAGAEEIADDVHAVHQRALDHLDRLAAARRDRAPRLFGVLDDERRDALDQRMREPLLDAAVAPRQILLRFASGGLVRFGERDELLRRTRAVGATAIQHDVLDQLPQRRIELVVDAELAGVHDAHRQAGADRMEQEHRVDRLAHRLVAAEAEADVRDAARHLRVRQVRPDPARRFDEVDGVVVVLVDAGGDREHVRVDDDVLGRKADAIDQQIVASPRDLRLALQRVGLALFVERHHDHRRAVAADERRLVQERLFALLERDRVHDRLALHALQTCLDHVPLRRIDHHRHARDVGLGRRSGSGSGPSPPSSRASPRPC